jgi:membrane protease YdiL (CAAX protease family)
MAGLLSLAGLSLWVLGVSAAIALLIHIKRHPVNMAQIRRRLIDRPWSLIDMSILMLLPVCTLSTGEWALQDLAGSGRIDESALSQARIVMHTLSFHLPVLLMTIVLICIRKLSLTAAFGAEQSGPMKQIVLGLFFWLATLPFVALAGTAASTLLHEHGFTEELQYPLLLLIDANPLWLKIYTVLAVTLLVPAAEEILFRGIGIPALSRIMGPYGAALISSLLFTLIHQNLFAMPPIFILSLGLSLAYMATGSLLVSISMHAAFNLGSILLFLLSSGKM